MGALPLAPIIAVLGVLSLLCSPPAPAQDNPSGGTTMDFVADGRAANVAYLGAPWLAREGYLEGKGVQDLGQRLLGRCVIGRGDFRIHARLAMTGLANSAAAFVLGDDSYFGFAGGHGKIFLTGPLYNNARGTPIGEPTDFMREGEPFDLTITRAGNHLRIAIDDNTVHEQEVGPQALGAPGFVPTRATMRIYSFSATGNLGPYVAPTVPAKVVDHIILDRRVKSLPGLPQGPFVRLKDGAILTVENTEVLVSRDEGRSWERRTVFTEDQHLRVRPERALLRTREGTIILVFLNDAALHYSWDKAKNLPLPDMHLPSYAICSRDEGKTWTDLNLLTDGWCGCIQDITQTRDGAIIIPGQELLYPEGRHATIPYVSRDDGRTWQRTRYLDIGGQGDHAGAVEGTLEQLRDGRIWLLMRTPKGAFYQSFSSDEGLTWTDQEPSAIPATSSPGKLERLASGRLVLVWNRLPHTPYKTREELSISFSEDEGATWTAPRIIATNVGSRVSYVHLFERAAGELWVTTMQGGLRAVLHEQDFLAPPPTVVAFGDSTTAPREGLVVYADLLRQGLLARGLGAEVLNAGVGGNTTEHALARLESDVVAHQPQVAVVQFGINDAAVDVWRDPPATEPRVPLAQFRRNLEQILDRLKECSISPILMTPNPMAWSAATRERYGKPPYDPASADGFNVVLRDYVQAVREVAAERGLPLVDVFATFEELAGKQAGGLDALLLDGMHPAQAGHDVIAQLLLEHVPQLAAQAPDRLITWRNAATLPVPCGGHAVTFLGGRIISAGGTTWQEGKKLWLSDVRAYDPAQDRWSRLGALPEPVGYAVAASDDSALYILGGADGTTTSRHCWRVETTAEGVTSDRLPDLPEARVFAAGARVERTLYVVGGASDASNLGTATSDLFALNLDRLGEGWKTLVPLPGQPRATHAAATAGDALYVFGGCHLDDKGVVRNLADAYRYDVRAGSWERLPDMPAANRALTAVDVSAREVLLFGGFTATDEECADKGDAFGFTAHVIRYNAAARTYSLLGALPSPNADAKPVRSSGELFLLGGEPAKRQRAPWVLSADLASLRVP